MDVLVEPDAVGEAADCSGFDSSDLLMLKPVTDYSIALASGPGSEYGLVQVPSESASIQDEAQLELAVEDDGVAAGGEDDGPILTEADREGGADDRAYMYIMGSKSSVEDVPALRSRVETDTDTVTATILTEVANEGFATKASAESDQDCSGVFPLGSSQNPIRIIQQGNKYMSTQQLSSDQLSQIMQVAIR